MWVQKVAETQKKAKFGLKRNISFWVFSFIFRLEYLVTPCLLGTCHIPGTEETSVSKKIHCLCLH